MLMDLSAYSPAALQSAAGLLASAAAAGIDLNGLRGLVVSRLSGIPAPSAPVDRVPGDGLGRGSRLCPSCGRGPLAPVANREGLRILGCRLCRYSGVMP